MARRRRRRNPGGFGLGTLLLIGFGGWLAWNRKEDADKAGVPLDLAFKHPLTPVAQLRAQIDAQSAQLRAKAAAATN